ncbi:MAG TPA: ABC transporter permease [bacterium]|nr:ABC transporter permease [bacterium]
MARVLAQARKELIQFLRDRLSLTLALVLPVGLLLLLGRAFSLSVTNVPIVVQDLDDSAISHDLVDALRASITFHVVPWPVDEQPDQALVSNDARAALVIPAHFGRDIARGVPSPVQLLVDGSDANTAKLISGDVAQIVQAYNERTAGAAQAAPVQAAVRLWYNPGESPPKFYGPGIFVMALSIFPALLATLAMAKEGEQKTILQVYVSSISAHEFLLGKILAFVAVALAETLVLLAVLLTSFDVGFAGDPTPFLVATILYAFCVAAFGVMVGAAIPNQAAAMQAVAFGGFMSVLLLSGLLFPIENIPAGLRWISNLVWGRYYIEVVRDALLQGGGWGATWYKVAIIGLIGAIFYGVAWRTMRRMQLAD